MKEQPAPYQHMILVCLNERPSGESSCGGRQSKPVADALKQSVNNLGLKAQIRVTKTHCLGQCDIGPNVIVYPEGTLFSGVSPADVPAIVDQVLKSETK